MHIDAFSKQNQLKSRTEELVLKFDSKKNGRRASML